MKNDLVSVIVPTYNRAYCLPRALDSALAQTHRNVEVLVIDDGSTDETRELLHARYGHETRVRYIYQENQRVSAARNRGLALATGAYVAFLDSDDYWMPWKLELQLECMDRAPEIGMVWTDLQAVDEAGQILHPQYLRTMYSAWRWYTTDQLFEQSYALEGWQSRSFRIGQLDRYSDTSECALAATDPSLSLYTGNVYSAMIMGSLVHTSTVLLRKERADKVRGFDVNFRNAGEDYDFHLRTCREGPVGFVDVPSIQYRIGVADQLTRPEFSVEVAVNFMTVVTRELQQERSRITLTNAMILAVLVEAHNWAGYELMGQGRLAEARSQFLRSLRCHVWQPRTLKCLVASSLLGGALPSVRKLFRGLCKNTQPYSAPR